MKTRIIIVIFLLGLPATLYLKMQPVDKVWEPPARNTANIRFEVLRGNIDAPFNRIHDSLSVAYYNFWKNSRSKKFFTFDKRSTPEASKALFDSLQALLWLKYDLRFHQANLARPLALRIPEIEYNEIISDVAVIKKDTLAEGKINAFKKRGLDFIVQ